MHFKELIDRIGDEQLGIRQLWNAAKEAHSTDDFSNLLSNTLEKKFFQQFKSWVPKWSEFCGTDSTGKLGVAMERPMLSELNLLKKKPQGFPIEKGKQTDNKLTVTTDTYGRGISITREAIINDDTGQLLNNATRFINAAQRTVDDAVASKLYNNAVAYDSVAFFASSAWPTGHANSGSTALSRILAAAQAVVDGCEAIKLQKDINRQARLGHRASILVVPSELESEATILCTNPVIANTTEASATCSLANPAYGLGLKPVVFDALSDYDTNNWYLFVNPSELPAIIVSFLNAQVVPQILRKRVYENVVDAYGNPACDFEFDCQFDFGVNWGDPRAAYGSIVSSGAVTPSGTD